MANIPMIARKTFAHAGQTFTAGDRFETTPVLAAVFHRRRQATFVPRTTTPTTAPTPAGRRHYKRRDLTAEPE